MFSHEKLQVYANALDFVSAAVAWTNAWDRKHAVVDQLDRTAPSILLNLAEAARRCGAPGRLQILDYATGSTLECAGCLDIARIKNLLTEAQCREEKQRLCVVTKMVIGLRKAWAESVARKEPADYSAKPSTPETPFFHHESLEVYRTALAFMDWFVSLTRTKELSNRLVRQVDEAGTSIVLNIAEGNGRYAELDHHRFAQIAQSAAVNAAVLLDLCLEQGLLEREETDAGKDKLHRIAVMLGGF
ncbi:MAG TPA: four helix bundle protein [Verrucomicrobiae bacterium]